jgi:two-component system alkaline phosphatase synthesis response regulator PhoP
MKTAVLIVDDEFGIADIVAEILAEEGYSVAIAINGQLGLACLEESAPDVVLLDVMMPILDGPGMLRAMRSDPRFLHIPVVMMTALPEALPKDPTPPLYQAVLYKPFTPRQLFEALLRVLDVAPYSSRRARR